MIRDRDRATGSARVMVRFRVRAKVKVRFRVITRVTVRVKFMVRNTARARSRISVMFMVNLYQMGCVFIFINSHLRIFIL